MKKYLYPIVTISLLFMSFYTTGFLLTKTDKGTNFVVNTINKLSPNLIEYDTLQGHLLGRLEISHLKIHLASGLISIDHLLTKNRFKLFSFKIKNDFLILDNIDIKPTFTSGTEQKSSGFRLPLTFVAKHITMNKIAISLGKNDKIYLPPLRAKVLLAPEKFGINLYQMSQVKPCLSYFQKYGTTIFNLNTPFKNTKWNIHYLKKGDNFNVQGRVADQKNGLLTLKGEGKTGHHLDFNMSATQIHPDQFFLEYWPGEVSFNLNIKQEKNTAEINLKDLAGTIHNQNIRGNAHLLLGKNKINDLMVDLTSNTSKILVQGSKQDKWNVDWSLQIPDLNLFFPKSKGTITATGAITGAANAPNFEGAVTIRNLHFQDYEIQDCVSGFKIDQETHHTLSTCHLCANNIHINHFTVNNIELNGQGTFKKHTLDLQAKLQDQTLKVSLDGSYLDKKWSSNIKNLNLNNSKQVFTLQKPSELLISKNNFALTPLCVSNATHKICLDGSYQRGSSFLGNLNLQNFDLSFFNFLLSKDQRLEGNINLDAAAKMSNSKNSVVINANLTPGIFHYVNDGESKELNYQIGKLNTLVDKNETLQTNFYLRFKEGQLTTQIKIPDFKFAPNFLDKKIIGDAKIQLDQLHFIETVIPAIRTMSGKIMANLNISGTIAKPTIKGNFNLLQGGFRIPKLNLRVNNVAIDAINDGSNVSINGHLLSGTGTLQFSGKGKFENGDLPLDLQLAGNNVLICNQPEIKITASPQMKLSLGKKELKLAGDITIPEAKLHPHDFGNAESVTDDIIFVEQDGKQIERSSLRISSDVNLILGNNIALTYKGIKGQILGQVHIQDDPNKATVAYGQLRLQDGTYSVYGKTLQIDNGKLNFTGGPISNPGLDIKASRTLQTSTKNTLFATQEQIRVGVNVLGSLKEPKITLFSEPGGKPPSDILSYLLLGIPADSVKGTNTELLMQAASTINGQGSNKLLGLKEQVKQSLGLSELDIGTQSEIDPKTQETFQHTAFVLGKYLSPKFYVNYSLDLFDHTNTFKVRYLLNRFWTIQSVANTNNSGVDILYTVEK